ncbi:Nramp family divalent metal transporter [Pyrobaculum sp.]|uniref:Nramp family divalent metal transporter n=1 Tax=Pyrobaculum sp. TaxID=2004705 RepID=UPI00318037CE
MRLIGPATVVSVAYLDPGNFGANIASGAKFGLGLLWVVWLSGALAVMYQYISGVLGLESGRGLLDHVWARLRPLRPAYAAALLVVALSTDLAEFVGLIVAFELLLGVPVYLAAALGSLDVVLLLLLGDRGRAYFSAIGLLASVVGVSFLLELIMVKPDLASVLYHSLVPTLDGGQALYAASILGATVMPHAVLLHSHIVGGLDRRSHRLQTLYNLGLASAVNASMQVMAAYALYGQDVDISTVPKVLEPLYGPLAGLAFSIALLSSGLASSAVSVQAGALVLERIFGRPVARGSARLAFRLVNIIPTAAMLATGVDPLAVLVYSQVVLSMALPAVLIPLVAYSKPYISRELAAAAYAATAFVILIDVVTVL